MEINSTTIALCPGCFPGARDTLPYDSSVLGHVSCFLTCEIVPRNFTVLLNLFTFIWLLLLVVYLIPSVLGHV
jgi:hypothetical protein